MNSDLPSFCSANQNQPSAYACILRLGYRGFFMATRIPSSIEGSSWQQEFLHLHHSEIQKHIGTYYAWISSQIPLSFGYVCVEMKLKSILVFKLFDVQLQGSWSSGFSMCNCKDLGLQAFWYAVAKITSVFELFDLGLWASDMQVSDLSLSFLMCITNQAIVYYLWIFCREISIARIAKPSIGMQRRGWWFHKKQKAHYT